MLMNLFVLENFVFIIELLYLQMSIKRVIVHSFLSMWLHYFAINLFSYSIEVAEQEQLSCLSDLCDHSVELGEELVFNLVFNSSSSDGFFVYLYNCYLFLHPV